MTSDEVVAEIAAPGPRAGPGLMEASTCFPQARCRPCIVGFPNVGKSTLVNRLAGGREAVVHSEAGVTRDRKRVRCEWNGREFDLLDTGGIDLDDESEMAADIQRQARLGMAEADIDRPGGRRPGRPPLR